MNFSVRTFPLSRYSLSKFMYFPHFFRCLEMNCTKFIPGLVDDLINHMVAILLQHSDGYLELKLYQEVANRTMEKLEQGQLPHLVWQLNALALDFSKRIDKLLLLQMEVIQLNEVLRRISTLSQYIPRWSGHMVHNSTPLN